MVLLAFVWKCFQDRNFHGVIVGLYKPSIESWVGLGYSVIRQTPPARQIITILNLKAANKL